MYGKKLSHKLTNINRQGTHDINYTNKKAWLMTVHDNNKTQQ